MEIGTTNFWEAVLTRVLPPRSREHVLGDLQERRQYLRDAFLVVPAVIWSQVRRAASPMLLSAAAVSIFSALIAAACLAPGTNPMAFFGDQAGLVRLAVITLAATAGIALADAYVKPEDRIIRACFSVGAACLMNLAVGVSPERVVVVGVILGTLIAVRLRMALSGSPAPHQGPERPVLASPAAVAIEAAKFQRTIHNRNMRECLGIVFVVVIFGFFLTRPAPPIKQAAYAVNIIAAVYVGWQIRTRGGGERMPATPEECVPFYRRQLVKQRDLLSSVWRWYLGPLLIGPTTLFVADTLHSGRLGASALSAGFYLALCMWIGWLNTRAARGMQQQIDDLDRLEI